MNLRPDLTAPSLDAALVAQLAQLADRIDSDAALTGERDGELEEFNRLAGSNLHVEDFQGIYTAEDPEDFVRRVLYRQSITSTPDISMAEMVDIVSRAISLEEDAHEEREYYIMLFDELCLHPSATDLIFYPELVPELEDVDAPTAEQIAEIALGWRPRILAMRIAERSGSEFVGYYIHRLEAPGIPVTQVVTPPDECYEPDSIAAVALKGVRLSDGSVVGTSFELGAMSNARILRIVTDEVGTELEG